MGSVVTYGRGVFWLSRPPYWRWLLAGLVVAVAAYMDLSGPATESYPFVARSATAGEELNVEWRQVPLGLLPTPEVPPALTWRSLRAGDPLVPGVAGEAPVVPNGWWALEMELPATAVPGGEVLVAIREPQLEVAGLVVAPPASGSFGSTIPGLVALPAEHAAAVANALAEHRASILIRP